MHLMSPVFKYKFYCLLIANTPSHVPAVFLFPGTEGDFGHVPGQAQLQSVMFMSWHWAAHGQRCRHLLTFRRGRAGSCRDSRVVGIEEEWIIVWLFSLLLQFISNISHIANLWESPAVRRWWGHSTGHCRFPWDWMPSGDWPLGLAVEVHTQTNPPS